MSCVYQTAEGQTAVAAVENGKVRIVPVETGVESDLNIEVKPADGAELNEGTAVILSPSPELYDGMAAAPTVCLLYTSPSPRDRQKSRMPSSA